MLSPNGRDCSASHRGTQPADGASELLIRCGPDLFMADFSIRNPLVDVPDSTPRFYSSAGKVFVPFDAPGDVNPATFTHIQGLVTSYVRPFTCSSSRE